MSARKTHKCQFCRRRVYHKEGELCIECFLDRLHKDCDELRHTMSELERRNNMMVGLYEKAVSIRDYTPTTPMSEREQEDMYSFMGREGIALMDRLDWLFSD